MASDRDTARLRRVLELTMATLGGDFPLAVGLDQLDSVANLGHTFILS